MLRGGRTAAGHLGATTRPWRATCTDGGEERGPQPPGGFIRHPGEQRAERPRTDHQEERLVEKHGALALLRFFAAQGGEPAPASRFRSGT